VYVLVIVYVLISISIIIHLLIIMSFQCDVCNKYYKTKKSLWQHNKNMHTNQKLLKKQKKFEEIICNLCNKSFSHKGNLIRHIKACKFKT
jgi:uncharacterized CHY-type Zn-finger protein